jgi:hypothetical protein
MPIISKARPGNAGRAVRYFAAGLMFAVTAGVAAVMVTVSLAHANAQMTGPGQSGARIEAAAAAAGEIARAPYQALLKTTCNAGHNRCDFTSAFVGASRRLEIHRVACRGDHLPRGEPLPQFETFAYAEPSAGAALLVDLPEVKYAVTNTADVWTISEPVLMFVPAANRLHMYVSVTTGTIRPVGCTVSGYLVTLGV